MNIYIINLPCQIQIIWTASIELKIKTKIFISLCMLVQWYYQICKKPVCQIIYF